MKRLAQIVTAPMRSTPVEVAERLVWWAVLVVVGFGVGWASAVKSWALVCVTPF